MTRQKQIDIIRLRFMRNLLIPPAERLVDPPAHRWVFFYMLTIIRFFINHFNDREFIASRQFLNTEAWHKVRNFARVKNRRQYGKLTCEACGLSDGTALCADHILPRKHYPRLALFSFNLQMLCDDCNRAKGSEYTDDFRSSFMYPLAVLLVWILR